MRPSGPRRGTSAAPISDYQIHEQRDFLKHFHLKIDWRDPGLLSRFITERGKIVPRRVSGVCAKNQRSLAKAIKRARHTALLRFPSDCASTAPGD